MADWADFFTPVERHATKRNISPKERVILNARNQLAILDGKDPISDTGKIVRSTVEKLPSGNYAVSIKYGTSFVPYFNGSTHCEVPADKVRAALEFFIARVEAGDLDEVLNDMFEQMSETLSNNAKAAKQKPTLVVVGSDDD